MGPTHRRHEGSAGTGLFTPPTPSLQESTAMGLTDAMIFDDLQPVEVLVRIEGKEYLLKEATGDAVTKWRNSQVRAARMTDGKVSGVGDIADSEPLLVSLCLFTLVKRNDCVVTGSLVPVQTVRSWPSRVQSALFERVKDISGLNEEETEESLVKSVREGVKRLRELRARKYPGGEVGGADPTQGWPDSTTAG